MPAVKLVNRRPPHDGSPRFPRSPPFETWSSFVPPGHVVSSSSSHEDGRATPSPSLPFLPSLTPPTICTICLDAIEDIVVDVPCGHPLDVSCLQTMFENATRDESLFPPKCCQTPIDLDAVRVHLGAPLIKLYQRKALEFNTEDRVYCLIPTCSAFLGAASTTPVVIQCRECHTETCGSCKEAAHLGRKCAPRRNLDDAMLEFAKEQGWQRCPACQYLVERTSGCNHITCRCKRQFCYLCGAGWKTCSCPSSGGRRREVEAVPILLPPRYFADLTFDDSDDDSDDDNWGHTLQDRMGELRMQIHGPTRPVPLY
ncbi:hypothetical protein C8Q74DRAFT_178680 [Fomes fomentarius]|nr:hypothetical protein C8Q74DRAFT_178680 [Fomes fomentarius]